MTAEPTVPMDDLIAAYDAHLKRERMLLDTTVMRYLHIVQSLAEFLRDQSGKRTNDALVSASEGTIVRFLASGATDASVPSRATWNLELAASRSFYSFLKKTKLVETNPTDEIARHTIRQREVSPLSFDELLALADAAEASGRHARRNVAIVTTLFHSALRVTEVSSLTRTNVDFDARVFLEVRLKGDKRVPVAFNDVIAEALEAYLAERTDAEPPLFLSDRGTALSVRSIQELVHRLAIAAKLSRPVTPHLFRHSSATALASLGTHMSVIQDMLGHASIITTRRYVHLGVPARREALEQLGKRWDDASRARIGNSSGIDG